MRKKTRAQYDALEAAGVCPECEQAHHRDDCRKQFFDWAYSVGYHDGANNLKRHGHAFLVEMLENDEYDE